MRRLATSLMLLTLLSGVVVSCSDATTDDAAKKPEATTAESSNGNTSESGARASDSDFVKKVIDSFGSAQGGLMNQKDARCVAEALDADMSDAAKASFDDESSEYSDLSTEDRAAFVKSFDDCVKIDDLVAGFTKGTGLDAKAASCVKSKLTGAYDTSGKLMEAIASQSSALTELYQGCVPATPSGGAIPSDTPTTSGAEPSSGTGSALGSALESQLQASGITAAQASCVSTKLQAKFSNEELTQMMSNPGKVVEAMAPISQECGIGG